MVGANSLANIWWGKKSLSLKFRTTDSYILGGWNYVLDCFGLDIWSIFFSDFLLVSSAKVLSGHRSVTSHCPKSLAPVLPLRERSDPEFELQNNTPFKPAKRVKLNRIYASENQNIGLSSIYEETNLNRVQQNSFKTRLSFGGKSKKL